MKEPETKVGTSYSLSAIVTIVLVPVIIVLAASAYYASEGIKQNLSTYAHTYIARLDEVIFELHRENYEVLKHKQNCDRLKQELLFESQFRELIIVKDNMAICSSRRGKISYDLSSLLSSHNDAQSAFLFDINQDPAQRTLIVINSQSGEVEADVLAIVDKGYLIDRLGHFSNGKLKEVTVQFGDKVYPVSNSIKPDTIHFKDTSERYGYTLLVQASSEYIRSHIVYTAITSLPFSLFVSFMIILSGRFLKQRDSLADDLIKGLGRHELFLVYQPIIDSRNHTITGLEALIRWQHPKLGRIRPDAFIPLAEREKLIDQITDYVLDNALNDLELLPRTEPIHLAINIPPSFLHEEGNLASIIKYAEHFRKIGYRLSVEVTERQVLDETARDALSLLRSKHVSIAIDDFGTGHTSLSVIQDTHFDYLKIDKCFIDSIGLETVNAPVLNTIVDLGHRLGVKIVAEGVESSKQVEYLTDIGATHLQGFYFAKPMTIEKLREYKVPHQP